MNTLFNRIVGILLIVAAIAGFLFSLVALAGVWRYRPIVTDNLTGTLKVASSTLDTTAEGLAVADQSLTTTITSTNALKDTIEAAAVTLNTTTPLVDMLVTLTKEDLPKTLETAQTSLASAEESAKVIDSVLTAITSIPFVSKDIYNPPVPLHIALQQISASLEPLPATLDKMEKSLTTTRENLQTIQSDVGLMSTDISQIKTSLESAQTVVKDYRQLVADTQTRVDRTIDRLPGWINALALVLTFLLIWAAVAQVGLFLQGWEMLHRVHDEP